MALPQRPATPSAAIARTRLVGPPRPREDVLARRRILPASPACPMGLGHQVSAVDEDRPAVILAFPGANPPARDVPDRPAPAVPRRPSPARSRPARAWSRLPAPLARGLGLAHARLRQARNLGLGSCVAFCDAALEILSPVGFLWRHAQVVGLGLLYLLVPLAAALGLLARVPSLGQAYAPTTLPGLIFLVGLYVSCAFAMVLGVVALRFAHRQARGLAAQLARKGESAFPG